MLHSRGSLSLAGQRLLRTTASRSAEGRAEKNGFAAEDYSLSNEMKSAGKLTLLVSVMLGLLCSALAVTVTYYTDTLCESPAAATFQGRPNPLVISLNKCEQSVSEADRTALWSRPTFCGFKQGRPPQPSFTMADIGVFFRFIVR
jgi:hypothetical protein